MHSFIHVDTPSPKINFRSDDNHIEFVPHKTAPWFRSTSASSQRNSPERRMILESDRFAGMVFPRVSSLSQCHLYLVDNAIHIIQHIMIPKADHFIALRFPISVSLNILRLVRDVQLTGVLSNNFFMNEAKIAPKSNTSNIHIGWILPVKSQT